MYEEIKRHSHDNKAVGAALSAGLLLNLAILFLVTDTPNDALGVLTGIYPVFPFDDQVLKYSLAMIFIALFCWRTVTLYRKRLVSISMQFQCLFLALIMGGVWFFIALALMRPRLFLQYSVRSASSFGWSCPPARGRVSPACARVRTCNARHFGN